MFCRWCGDRIINNAEPCPSCGKIQDALENGNGFWDLCDFEPPAAERGTVPIAEMGISETKDGTDTLPKSDEAPSARHVVHKTEYKTPMILYVILVMLMAVLLESTILLVRASYYSKQLSSLQSTIDDTRNAVSGNMAEIKESVDRAVRPASAESTGSVGSTKGSESKENSESKEGAEGTGGTERTESVGSTKESESKEGAEGTGSTESTEVRAANNDLNQVLRTSVDIKDDIPIETLEIYSENANLLWIAAAAYTEEENAGTVWQSYDAYFRTWSTLVKNQRDLVVSNNNDMDRIRAFCVVTDKVIQQRIHEIHGEEYHPNEKKDG